MLRYLKMLFEPGQLRLSAAIAGLAAACFLGMVAVGALAGVPIEELTPDIQAIGGHDFYVGSISQLGLFGWTIGAAVALFTGLTGRRWDVERANALVGLGLVTAWLAIDDMFMLHEQPLLKVGIPEWVTFAAMGAAMIGVVLRYSSTILAGPVALAATAAGSFVIALSADLFLDHNFYLEDGFKFVGIWTWAAFLVALSRQTVLRAAERSTVGAMPAHDNAPPTSSDGPH